MTESQRVLQEIKGKLVVSCQALPHEPLHSSYIMSRMAVAAMQGGAAGIRAQSVSDINAIAEVCHLPIIGIVKRNYDDRESERLISDQAYGLRQCCGAAEGAVPK